MSNTFNVAIGAANALWDGRDLGETKEGIKVNFKANHVELKTDRSGDTPVEIFVSGYEYTADMEFVGITKDAFLNIIAGKSGVEATDTVTLSGSPCLKVPAVFQLNTLDGSKSVTFHRVVLIADSAVEYSNKNQRYLKASFQIQEDPSQHTFDVISMDPATKTIELGGLVADHFTAGDEVIISHTAGINDGTYTVVSATNYPGNDPQNTGVVVAEVLTTIDPYRGVIYNPNNPGCGYMTIN